MKEQVIRRRVKSIDVMKSGEKIIIPERMSYADALKAVEAQRVYEESIINFHEEFHGYFPLDAAHAFYMTLLEKFGLVQQKAMESFFGTRPPSLVQVSVSETETVQVPWGRISLPGMDDAWAETQMQYDNDGAFCTIMFQSKRKFGDVIKELAQQTRKYLLANSIYKGKALSLKFRDKDGQYMSFTEVNFMAKTKLGMDDVVFNDDVQAMIDANIFTPVRYTDSCRTLGIPIKRGVLLAGPYGTGKTLVSSIVAKEAVENGFTFIYIKDAKEFVDAYRVAQIYAPSVIFCEDIDSITSGARGPEMNEILNTLDGISSKGSEVIAIFTTNKKEDIHKGFQRPGRIDSIIDTELPDAKSAALLMRLYGRELIPESEDLSEPASMLSGTQPAVIREAVEKAKLMELTIRNGNINEFTISAEGLKLAAMEMEEQIAILRGKKEEPLPKAIILAEVEVLPDGSGVRAIPADPNYNKLADKVGQAMGKKVVDGLRKMR